MLNEDEAIKLRDLLPLDGSPMAQWDWRAAARAAGIHSWERSDFVKFLIREKMIKKEGLYYSRIY